MIIWGVKQVRRRVRVPIRKLNKGKRIDCGIELVRRRVCVPGRKLIRGGGIDWRN